MKTFWISAVIVIPFALGHNAHAGGRDSFYSIAPGTPVCSPGEPIVCAWSIDGLAPVPSKYAIEAIADYDPQCSGGSAFSATFPLASPGANPSIAIMAGTLDRTICLSNDDPCSRTVVMHAARMRIRVKALDPPSKTGGAQDSPFSAPSAAIQVPGTCAAACPQACVDGIDQLLTDAQSEPGWSIPYLTCSYDTSQQAGSIAFGAGNAAHGGPGFIGAGSYTASFDGIALVNVALSPMEQDACAAQFAPALASLAGTGCDISPP